MRPASSMRFCGRFMATGACLTASCQRKRVGARRERYLCDGDSHRHLLAPLGLWSLATVDERVVMLLALLDGCLGVQCAFPGLLGRWFTNCDPSASPDPQKL